MSPEEEQQFADFVRERGDHLLRFARYLVPDASEAEDLLQAALLRLVKHWSRPLESPEAYVRTTLANLAKDRHKRSHLVAVPVEAPQERVDESPEMLDALMAQARLDHLLGQLPERQRTTVALRVLEGLSEAETAAVMDCAVGTVKSNLARGLQRVRQVLASEHESEGTAS